MFDRGVQRAILPITTAVLLAAGLVERSSAQGVLVVTPGRTTASAAGTGTYGYGGDNGAATAATLALPAAVAYDAAGNIFIADANNHAVREIIKSTGRIVTVAGTGIAGFTGDGAAATSAQLDTPTGVAVDTAGNLYIADSHNNRIRKVTGTAITTVAGGGATTGNGTYSATSVALALPTAVAVDGTGNVYIADTNNHVIRKLTGTTITTIAGNGEQQFAGDGAAATAASLDSPTGIAVHSAGNLYIADRLNQRIRVVNAAGTISTLAGSGTPSFAGSFSGDGATATAASLARPTGISVDAAGNVYVADTNNQRIRQIGNGAIATVAGNGEQGSGTSVSAPRSVSADSSGNLSFADSLNQRVVASTEPTLTFAPQGVGTPAPSQAITLTNSGNATLTLAPPATTANFAIASGGTCPSGTITLAAGGSCTVNVTYIETAGGATGGTVQFGGATAPNQSVQLATTPISGTTPLTGSSSTVNTSQTIPIAGQPITYSLQVTSQNGVGTPSGTFIISANGVPIGSVSVVNGTAQITTRFATAGRENIVATYSGDTFYASSTVSYVQTVEGFTLAPQSTASQNVQPAGTASYTLTIAPVAGPFTYPITFTATGAPAGAIITFTPATVTPGGSPTNVTMTVKIPAITAALHRSAPIAGAAISFALLLLPFSGRLRRRLRVASPCSLAMVALLGLLALGGLAGCGTDSGYFGQTAQRYSVVVTSTGTGTGGATLQQTTTVQLTVQ